MIPLRDENPSRTFPVVTIAIIAINVLVFVYELMLGDSLPDKIMRFGAIPYNISHFTGIKVLPTLFTAMFFHGGFMHIVGNMWYLWIFGNNIEDRLGHLKFLFFYLSCGLIATLGYVFTNSNSELPMIGASGAISGVLGAYIILYPKARVLVLLPFFYIWRIIRLQAIWFLGFWILLQFFYGTASFALADASGEGGVAWFAHIFGFFAGWIFLGIFLENRKDSTRD